ncbi:filamentous hemagglutinin N-terminal domain-containing protein, partial [Salmonella enterica]|nr:filamentous hemagglutinin N-terminal domain-containing protein [Salmonella enterica]
MNKIYKLKFDKRRNELVVVSEITAGMGKEKSTGHIADLSALSPFRKLLGTLTPLALLTGLIAGLLPAMVLANPDLPTGGQIVGGQGSISTSGNQMTIHQQTQNMATNWHSFDVGKNNTVQFMQPDSSSVALNRVTGASGSQIMGTLKANGQVFILNPNGVLFGKDARVNVAGLVASTKNISTADFMKGQYTLGGSAGPGAQVINQGSLTTSKGGYIVLAGERVSNSGTVTTPSGKAVLAAGKTVTLQLDNGGLTSVSVNGSVVNALVENRGLISANDGQVYLTAKGQDMLLNTVVNNSGTIEAKGLTSRGGEIVLNGGDSGVVSQSGQLLADSQTGQGGKITLEGQNIHLAGNSLTSATGKTGGGEVYVGGGWQGKDSHIKNAAKVVMDKAATVDVSATDAGNGGTAVLWSDDYTNFRGAVLAKGGAQSGNGGQVETSSHQNLQASGAVDASARAGRGGEWLLDPTDVTIVGTGADTGIDSATADGTDIFTPTASGAKILNTSIADQLNAGTSVTVKTSGTDTSGQKGNITVNADILKTQGGDATLTLLADNDILLGANGGDATAGRYRTISSTDGKLNLTLLAGGSQNGSISLGRDIHISLNGGDFLADSANPANTASISFVNNGYIQGSNITLNVARGLSGYAYALQADKDLTINGPVGGSTGYTVPLNFTAGGILTINSPTTISLSSPDTTKGGGTIIISGDKGVSLNTDKGDITLTGLAASSNRVNVTSNNGTVSMGAGGNLNLTYANVSSGEGQDVTLLAAGKTSGIITVQNSKLTTSGGNITLNQKNHTTTDDDGADVTSPYSMTVKVDASNLDASSSDTAIPAGDIRINAWNPNVNLLNATSIRNAGSMLQVSGNSNLRGKDVLLHTEINGSAATGLPVFLFGASITAEGDISLDGVAQDGATASSLELRGANNTLNAQGNITLRNSSTDYQRAGVFLNASSASDISLTVGNNIILDGSGTSGSGVQIAGATLNASHADITGSSTSGNGFSITRSSLAGELADMSNVTLSSAGSAASVTNVLDNSVVTATSRDNLLAKKIENMTIVDMGGEAIFDDTSHGWAEDYTDGGSNPDRGWIFNHTSVNAGGLVQLEGVGFSNTTMNITDGGLNITQERAIQLTNTTLNVSGDVVLNSADSLNLTNTTLNEQSYSGAALNLSGAHNVTLTGLNVSVAEGNNQLMVSAGGNLTLNNSTVGSAGTGVLDISLLGAGNATGMLLVQNSNLTSNGGNITLNQKDHTTTGDDSTTITNPNAMTVKVHASRLNATSSDTALPAGDIRINAWNPNVNLSADAYITTVRNGNAMIQLSGNSNLSGKDVLLHTEINGAQAAGLLPVFLNGASITADGDITADSVGTNDAQLSTLELRGAGNTLNAQGNITLRNNSTFWNQAGIYLNTTSGSPIKLTAGKDITIEGSGTTGVGINIKNAAISGGDVTLSGRSSSAMAYDAFGHATFGGIYLHENVNMTSTGRGIITGISDGKTSGGVRAGGIKIGDMFTGQSHINLNGSFEIDATNYDSGRAIFVETSGLYFNLSNGETTFKSTSGGDYAAWGGVNSANWTDNPVNFILDNATLNINTQSNGSSSIFGGIEDNFSVGMAFSGQGDVNIVAKTNAANEAPIQLNHFNNINLNGKLTVNAINESGPGISIGGLTHVGLVNASIHGESHGRGAGIIIAPTNTSPIVNLNNNDITGVSAAGTGVQISGVNVTITNGSLNGISSGAGAGVILSGGSKFTLDGATVTGSSVDGNAISVTGNLALNNNATLNGTATGTGNGVGVSGNLISSGGAEINGNSSAGNGVAVTGDTHLTGGVNITGRTDTTGSGSGVSIGGNLTTDEQSHIRGNATASGSGVSVGAGLSGADVSGVSASGTGIELADHARVLNSTLNGSSTSGSGMAVTGGVTLDDTSVANITAGSVDGDGLSLQDGAAITVTDSTTGDPVTAPAVMTGTSENGSGVSTQGCVSLSGVMLNGTATTDTGTGVTLGGSLTLADAISGVQASSTANGTALVLDNADINASGYAGAGQDYTLSATTTGNGAAVQATGDNTLTSVVLSGTSTGSGPAMVVNGTLSTDRDVTATAQGGTGLVLDGGTLSSSAADDSPVTVTATTTGQGTAVQVAGGADSALHNVVLNGSAETGTTLDVEGNLTSDINITVSTGNGTAVSFDGGRIQSADSSAPVTVNVSATGDNGTAVHVDTDSTGALSDIILNTTSTQGDALKVEGTLTTQNTTVHTSTTGTGTALNVSGGTLSSSGNTVVNAASDTGHAAVVSDGTLASTAPDGLVVNASTNTADPALNISGNSEVTHSQVNGENNGAGSAVEISGHLSSSGEGTVTGQTTGGSGVMLADGTTVAGVTVMGSATTGTGLNISGNATLSNATLHGSTQTGTGSVVAGNLTADGHSQVTGTATQDGGSGVNLAGNVTGGSVSGNAAGSGAGVTVSGQDSTATDTVISGTTADGKGVAITGNLTSAGSTTV